MIEEKLKKLPTAPGCYLMKDSNGIVIYVGKAKNLKRRVTSYFIGKHENKTAILIKNIADFDYIVTSTEIESLILELNLIKKHEPKYNVLYKDDKTYPYIGITNDAVPRIKIYRSLYKEKENITLYGPYPNVMAARNIVELLNKLYPLPKCKTYPKKKCLYYHLNQCLGYCTENIDVEVINGYLKEVKQFLMGDFKLVKKRLLNKISFLNKSLAYEQAMDLKKYLDAIDIVFGEQKVEIKQIIDADIIGTYTEKNYMIVNILFLRYGKLINTKNFIIPILESANEELVRFLFNYYTRHQIKPQLVISEIKNEALNKLLKINLRKPQRGEFLSLLKLSQTNAKEYYGQNIDNFIKINQQKTLIWEKLASIIEVPDLKRIEMFDNAHLFGTNAVSGMVVYENGEENYRSYRKFKIKYSKQNDDYAMLREVLFRRYNQLIINNIQLPEVIMVDGGLGHINIALEVINELKAEIKVFGLAKDDKHKTKYLINQDGLEIKIIDQDIKNFLARMQNEVHRYTIKYHDQTRNKKNLISELDLIPKIGPIRKKILYDKYKDINNMKNATIDDLMVLLGKQTGTYLYNYWHH